MSYTLESIIDDEVFDTSKGSWRYLAMVAYTFGWEPKGTTGGMIVETGKEIVDWDGSYFAEMCFQVVDSEDALRIADALERAASIRSGAAMSFWVDASAFSHLAANRDALERFAAFCRKGGFTIC